MTQEGKGAIPKVAKLVSVSEDEWSSDFSDEERTPTQHPARAFQTQPNTVPDDVRNRVRTLTERLEASYSRQPTKPMNMATSTPLSSRNNMESSQSEYKPDINKLYKDMFTSRTTAPTSMHGAAGVTTTASSRTVTSSNSVYSGIPVTTQSNPWQTLGASGRQSYGTAAPNVSAEEAELT